MHSQHAVDTVGTHTAGPQIEALHRCTQPLDSSLQIPLPGSDHNLTVFTAPTPRWPDLMCLYDASSRLLFSSKFFSAHVSPAALSDANKTTAFDVGGWEVGACMAQRHQ